VQLGHDTGERSMRADVAGTPLRASLIAVGVGLLYYLAARIGFELRDPDAPAALLWPAAGVGFASFALGLHHGRRPAVVAAVVAVGIGVASFVANHLDGKPVGLSIAFTAANLTESGVGAYVFWRLRRGRERPMTFVLGLVAAVFVGSAAGALVAEVLVAPQLESDVGSLSRYWFVPDAGIWVVAPAFLLLDRRFTGLWGPVVGVAIPAGRRLEAAGQVALLAALVTTAFGRAEPLALAYLPLPALLWAAARLGPRWTTLSVLATAVAAVLFTRADRGPFVIGSDPDVNLIVAQVFLVVTSATGLVLVALVAEREHFASLLC
jgi:integral membrane sensor domain MASE1